MGHLRKTAALLEAGEFAAVATFSVCAVVLGRLNSVLVTIINYMLVRYLVSQGVSVRWGSYDKSPSSHPTTCNQACISGRLYSTGSTPFLYLKGVNRCLSKILLSRQILPIGHSQRENTLLGCGDCVHYCCIPYPENHTQPRQEHPLRSGNPASPLMKVSLYQRKGEGKVGVSVGLRELGLLVFAPLQALYYWRFVLER